MIGEKRHTFIVLEQVPGRDYRGCKLWRIKCENCGAEKILPSYRFKKLGHCIVCDRKNNAFNGMTRKRKRRIRNKPQPMSKEQFRQAVLRDQLLRRMLNGYDN
jgi:hypothetical protein